jgi:hypothetical protein
VNTPRESSGLALVLCSWGLDKVYLAVRIRECGFDSTIRPVYYKLFMDDALSTRDHLLEVGLERLRSTGYTATGVKEVLDLAKVPKGSFYHYFPRVRWSGRCGFSGIARLLL